MWPRKVGTFYEIIEEIVKTQIIILKCYLIIHFHNSIFFFCLFSKALFDKDVFPNDIFISCPVFFMMSLFMTVVKSPPLTFQPITCHSNKLINCYKISQLVRATTMSTWFWLYKLGRCFLDLKPYLNQAFHAAYLNGQMPKVLFATFCTLCKMWKKELNLQICKTFLTYVELNTVQKTRYLMFKLIKLYWL